MTPLLMSLSLALSLSLGGITLEHVMLGGFYWWSGVSYTVLRGAVLGCMGQRCICGRRLMMDERM
jgi:hypothetical protein